MTEDEIIRFVESLGGVYVQRARAGNGSPEIAWGDTFFTYAPEATGPPATQPFATIVTKDYPGDASSRLDRPDVFRLNIAAGSQEFLARTGRSPREAAAAGSADPAPDALDVIIAHPVYGTLGWLAVNNPGPDSSEIARQLLRQAHGAAAARHRRRRE